MSSIIPSASRVARSAFGGVMGQSLGLHYSQTGSWAALQGEMVARAASRVITSVGQINGCFSGRASCRTIAEADGNFSATGYWWDDIGVVPGQILSDMLADIALLPQALDFVVWNQGEADSNALNGTQMPAATAWTLRYNAVRSIIGHTRATLGLPNLPFFLDMPASSASVRNRAFERRRQCDFHIIRTTADTSVGVEQYDLPRTDSTHLTHSGARDVGRRQGHNIAAALFGAASFYRGPSVASVTQISATQTDVVVTVEAGDVLIKPALVPTHWRIESDTAYGAALAISAVAWTGNTVRLTHASCAGSPVFFLNYDDCISYLAARACGGSVSRMPLRSRDLGWTTAL